jgi:hypothetical protein
LKSGPDLGGNRVGDDGVKGRVEISLTEDSKKYRRTIWDE